MKNTILPMLTCLALSYSTGLYSQMCTPASSATTMDVNNVSTVMLNGGDMWWDFNQSRYEIPKGSGKSCFFSHALWLAGTDLGGTEHVAAIRYRQTGNDYWPGPMINGSTDASQCSNFDRHWSVTKAEIAAFVAGNSQTTPEAILHWPAIGNPNLSYSITQQVAPFHDTDGDGVYDPSQGDYPAIKGDQAVYWVMNDMGNIHTESGGYALGVEVHVMAYAYSSNDVINNTTFYDYTVINKSAFDYQDFRIGLFTDTELGNPYDDYIGCDSTRSLGFTYNGDDTDEDGGGVLGYGTDLPVAGIRMVQHPTDEDGVSVGMSKFGYFNNSGGPQATTGPVISSEYYNYMRGLWKDNTPWTKGANGYLGNEPANYMFPGNPADSNSWSECSAHRAAGDRRMIQSFGPLYVESGERITFSYAAIWSSDPSFQGSCSDLSAFFTESDQVKDFSDDRLCENFNVSLGATITSPSGAGNDGSIELIVQGTVSQNTFEWSTGATTKNISGLSEGTYTVTVTNEYGCTEEQSFEMGPNSVVELNAAQLALFPNPSQTGVFQVKYAGSQLQVRTFNLLGEQVNEQTAQGQLDLSGLSDGVYIVQIRNGEHTDSQRVVIAH